MIMTHLRRDPPLELRAGLQEIHSAQGRQYLLADLFALAHVLDDLPISERNAVLLKWFRRSIPAGRSPRRLVDVCGESRMVAVFIVEYSLC